MRNASIAVLREIGVDTGGSNVQFAVNPDDRPHGHHRDEPAGVSLLGARLQGDRLSRSPRSPPSWRSATRSTSSTTTSPSVTPASFEPTIDYVVTKMPRFTFEKFPGAEPMLTTAMKSVGEAMAIGRTFQESLQKALRSMETGLTGLERGRDCPAWRPAIEGFSGEAASIEEASLPRLIRAVARPLLVIAQAMRHGLRRSTRSHAACRYRSLVPRARSARSSMPRRTRCAPTACPMTATALRLRLKTDGLSPTPGSPR